MPNEVLASRHPLFCNISREDLSKLMECLHIYERQYKKGEYIVIAGMPIRYVCVILKGRIFMEQVDDLGNKYLYTEIRQRNLFGEPYLYPGAQDSTVNYKANSDCSILFIEYGRLLHSCPRACPCHRQLIENFIDLIVLKNRLLMQKIEILSKRSLRDRLLTYFVSLAEQQNSSTVLCPLSRTELADFLCVNRSSMTRELNRMREEGLLEFNRRCFQLKYPQ